LRGLAVSRIEKVCKIVKLAGVADEIYETTTEKE
jgi:hypothetical protein